MSFIRPNKLSIGAVAWCRVAGHRADDYARPADNLKGDRETQAATDKGSSFIREARTMPAPSPSRSSANPVAVAVEGTSIESASREGSVAAGLSTVCRPSTLCWSEPVATSVRLLGILPTTFHSDDCCPGLLLVHYPRTAATDQVAVGIENRARWGLESGYRDAVCRAVQRDAVEQRDDPHHRYERRDVGLRCPPRLALVCSVPVHRGFRKPTDVELAERRQNVRPLGLSDVITAGPHPQAASDIWQEPGRVLAGDVVQRTGDFRWGRDPLRHARAAP